MTARPLWRAASRIGQPTIATIPSTWEARPSEGLLAGVEEVGLEQEILGRVAADHQLGEDDEIGPGLARPPDPLGGEGGVAVDVADGRVHLGQREADARIGARPCRRLSRPTAPVGLAPVLLGRIRCYFAPAQPTEGTPLLRRHVLVTTLLACALAVGFSTGAAAASAPAVSHAAAQQAAAERPGRLHDSAEGRARPPAAATPRSRCATWRNALPALHGADRKAARALLARPTDKSDRGYFGKEAPDSPICDAAVLRPLDGQGQERSGLRAVPRRHPRRDGAELHRREHEPRLEEGQVRRQARQAPRRSAATARSTSTSPTSGRACTATPRPDRWPARHEEVRLPRPRQQLRRLPDPADRVDAGHRRPRVQPHPPVQLRRLRGHVAVRGHGDVGRGAGLPGHQRLPQLHPGVLREAPGADDGLQHQDLLRGDLEPLARYKYGSDIIRHTWEVSPSQKHFAVASYNRAIKDAERCLLVRQGARPVLRGHGGVPFAVRVPRQRRVPGREALGHGRGQRQEDEPGQHVLPALPGAADGGVPRSPSRSRPRRAPRARSRWSVARAASRASSTRTSSTCRRAARAP